MGVDTAVVTVGAKLNDSAFHRFSVEVDTTRAIVSVESSSCSGGSCRATATLQSSGPSSFSGLPTMGGLKETTPQIKTHLVGKGYFIGCIEVGILIRSRMCERR